MLRGGGGDGAVGRSGAALIDPGRYLTDLPEGWRARCADPALARHLSACSRIDAASGAEAEQVAFELNVEASRRGILPRGLAELHFSHGVYAAWSVVDLEHALRIGTAPPPPPHVGRDRDPVVLAALAAAVNRAFLDGRDAGALAIPVSTSICGERGDVDGLSSAPCAGLDGECVRGRFDERAGCCVVERAPTGAVCEAGVCDGSGACVDSGAVSDADRVRGPLAWLDPVSGGEPLVWYLSEPRVRVAVSAGDDASPVDTGGVAADGGVTPEDWVPRYGGAQGAPVFELERALAETTRIAFSRIADEGAAGASAVDSLGASVLYVANTPARVCVVAGRRIDELGPVMSDCSTGGVELACPGDAGAIRCALEDGAAKITGEDLTFAFEVPDEEPRIPLGIHDMIPLDFPGIICLTPACQQLMHRHRVHFRIRRTGRTCEVSPSVPDCLGDELCFSGSGPERCFCASHPEVCGGGDDDCDGRVDEGGNALCDDGVPCTLDRCSSDGCLPSPPELNQYACRPAFCVYAVCNGEPPVHGRFGVPHDPSEPLRGPDANGCQVAFEDGWCDHSWDQCACNGRSACDPMRAAASGNRITRDIGCVEVEPAGALPCERAGDHDLCTPELCCEQNPDACWYTRTAGRDHAPLVVGTTLILPKDDLLCTDQRVPRRTILDSDGRLAACVATDELFSERQRVQLGCNDGDPCTYDTCRNPATGMCRHAPLDRRSPDPSEIRAHLGPIAVGSPILLDPGCTGDGSVTEVPAGSPPPESYLNRGCQRRECRLNASGRSICQRVDVISGGPHLDCAGLVVDDQSGGTPCAERTCRFGSCVVEGSDAHCDDGVACTQNLCLDSTNLPPCPPNTSCLLDTCYYPAVSGQCYIGGRCYDSGENPPHPSNVPPDPCRECRPHENPYDWTFLGGEPGCFG